jgi:molybdopterin/thiamine biosynthesis adenylyltransferase
VANCAEAGVLGPVVGVVGALQADLALRVLDGAEPFGSLVTYDGRADRLRTHRVPARPACDLCGKRELRVIERSRYIASDPCAP